MLTPRHYATADGPHQHKHAQERLLPSPQQPIPRPAQDRSWPMAGGLVAVGLWGLAPVATRAAVAHLAPLPLLVLRLGVAGLVLLPWAVPVIRRLRPRSAARLIAAGTLGLIGYNLPVTLGLQWLPASTAGLLLATEPVWVMVLGYMFLSERGGARAWLGSAIALGGVAVLAGPAALTGAGGYRALAGTGLVLAGTLAFGAYTIVLRPLSQAYGAVPATAASTVAGAIPYLAFAGTLSAPRLAQLAPSVWGELAFLALGSTAAGMLLWNRAVLSAGSTRVSMLLYLEPAVSVLGALVFLGEHVTLAMIAGGLLILAGVTAAGTTHPIASLWRQARRRSSPQNSFEDPGPEAGLRPPQAWGSPASRVQAAGQARSSSGSRICHRGNQHHPGSEAGQTIYQQPAMTFITGSRQYGICRPPQPPGQAQELDHVRPPDAVVR